MKYRCFEQAYCSAFWQVFFIAPETTETLESTVSSRSTEKNGGETSPKADCVQTRVQLDQTLHAGLCRSSVVDCAKEASKHDSKERSQRRVEYHVEQTDLRCITNN